MKKYLTEEEMYPMLAQFATQIHEQIEDLKDSMNKRFDEIDKRLDNHETRLERIESNMVQKGNFISLVKILERKKVITKYESAHILHPNTI